MLMLFGIFTAIYYILWSFGIFFPVLVSCIKKNLATLATGRRVEARKGVGCWVARWFAFKPKILIWENFGRKILVYFMRWPL
jgi:hypothetical protein